MTTANTLCVGLNGVTGTGIFVGTTSPSLATPTLGAATASSITWSTTADGIVGTTTNDNASAGYVGQLIFSQIASGSSVVLSNSTPANITTISVTAGDWDIFGNVVFLTNSGTPDSNLIAAWTSNASASPPAQDYAGTTFSPAEAVYGRTLPPAFSVPMQRYSLSSTTTIYLSVKCQFTLGTVKAYGSIYARRVR